MYFGKETALKAHVLHNIPEDLWYATTNNGVIRLALARQVELQVNPVRRNLKPGTQKPYFEIFMNGYSPTLNFSNKAELMYHDGAGRPGRLANGICGNLSELDHFSQIFPVVQGLPIWIPPAEKLRDGNQAFIGYIGNRADFNTVIELARQHIVWSKKQLK